ncbi:MAG: hypothetical protein GKR90_23680 [Pseudomonadales bacterium]|nr:hypothetical protein [Pseudomonadales bacterium]
MPTEGIGIALYFDKIDRKFAADHVFQIPTWPARSSDHQVNELASLLQKPIPITLTKATNQSTSPSDAELRRSAGSQTKTLRSESTNRVAVLTFIFLGVLFYLITTIESQPSDVDETLAGEETLKITESVPHIVSNQARSAPQSIERRPDSSSRSISARISEPSKAAERFAAELYSVYQPVSDTCDGVAKAISINPQVLPRSMLGCGCWSQPGRVPSLDNELRGRLTGSQGAIKERENRLVGS